MHKEVSSNKLNARVSKDWCQLQQKFLKYLRSSQKVELGLPMPAIKILESRLMCGVAFTIIVIRKFSLNSPSFSFHVPGVRGLL